MTGYSSPYGRSMTVPSTATWLSFANRSMRLTCVYPLANSSFFAFQNRLLPLQICRPNSWPDFLLLYRDSDFPGRQPAIDVLNSGARIKFAFSEFEPMDMAAACRIIRGYGAAR